MKRGKQREYKKLVCDFETTVFDGQDFTEVWASACVELYTEDVKIFGSIDETFSYFKSLDTNIIGYYHNLKFDGEFWMSYLVTNLHMKQAYYNLNEEGTEVKFKDIYEMDNNTFSYVISQMGQWYKFIIKVNDHIIELRDSLKLIPFSVKEIGKAFKTKHQKLDMEYEGFRYAGCEITEKEREYIANDVLVVKEALETMFSQGHNSTTIGSCCLTEFKNMTGKHDYKILFPNMTKVEINKEEHKYETADEWIRKSYRGGWCYLVKGKEGKVYHNGTTADVNSLYPSMMSSESGNAYPYGQPYFWTGDYIPEEALKSERYYFIRFRTRFVLKEGYLPFVQIKGNHRYKSTESLTTSDFYDKRKGKYCKYVRLPSGKIEKVLAELTMTMTDYELFREHYDVENFEILDGCWFYTLKGMFDDYMEKYKQQKLNSKGAMRTLAKLFLNNLYGKMASSTDSSFKVSYEKEDGTIGYFIVKANEKSSGYIPVGSAITSYARNFTIRAAQKNYHGVDKRGFIYADTDSIHCDLQPDEIQGITVHDKNFCCWKLESSWDEAIFTRQKTYIEHVTHNDLEPVESPYYDIKCAGMPQYCKNLFLKSIDHDYVITENDLKDYTEEELEFIKTNRTIEDFKVGLRVYGKLVPHRIKGGILLVKSYYEMRPSI